MAVVGAAVVVASQWQWVVAEVVGEVWKEKEKGKKKKEEKREGEGGVKEKEREEGRLDLI